MNPFAGWLYVVTRGQPALIENAIRMYDLPSSRAGHCPSDERPR